MKLPNRAVPLAGFRSTAVDRQTLISFFLLRRTTGRRGLGSAELRETLISPGYASADQTRRAVCSFPDVRLTSVWRTVMSRHRRAYCRLAPALRHAGCSLRVVRRVVVLPRSGSGSRSILAFAARHDTRLTGVIAAISLYRGHHQFCRPSNRVPFGQTFTSTRATYPRPKDSWLRREVGSSTGGMPAPPPAGPTAACSSQGLPAIPRHLARHRWRPCIEKPTPAGLPLRPTRTVAKPPPSVGL